MQLLQRLLLPSILAATVLVVGGCSTAGSVLTNVADLVSGRGLPSTDLESIQVVAMPDANQTSATQVDVVFVYREELLAMLPKKSDEWFQRKDEFEANLWKNMDILSLEIPPAYVIDELELPDRHGSALRVTVFANYLDKKGRKPLDLTASVRPRLTLGAKKLALSESE